MKGQQIKEEVKERYGKIALAGKSSEGCALGVYAAVLVQRPQLCKLQKTLVIMLRNWNLCLRPLFSEWCCGAPVNFADIKEGEVVVDIGSGGGIDVFLSANKVKDSKSIRY